MEFEAAMPWPDDYILYSINVEDVRQVVEEEGLRELTDDEVKRIGDKVGEYIDWHEALLTVIQEVAPDATNPIEEKEVD